MSLTVEPFETASIDTLLPLIAGYQQFYGATVDSERNRRHFSALGPEDGKVFLLKEESRAIGFATFYITYSTVRADRLLLLNDLYVEPSHRGKGAGKFLLLAAAEWARAQGYPSMEWHTAPHNTTARRLYDRVGGRPETWIHYTLTLGKRESGDTPPP